MGGIEAYLAELKRNMRGMDPRIRDDVIRELKSHVHDAAAASGGMENALKGLEPAKQLASRYKELYGYGTVFKSLFIAGGGLLSIASIPILYFYAVLPEPNLLAALGLTGLVAYLIGTSLKAGKRVGMYASLAAAGVRISSLSLPLFSGEFFLNLAEGVAFVMMSLGLVLVGLLPGRAKERWKGKEHGL